uniref:Cytochrome P450 n=1 Tax=Kalanchoe fedtschenkoi TaxID=63787 RepID=A0A7N0TYV2_KALFE
MEFLANDQGMLLPLLLSCASIVFLFMFFTRVKPGSPPSPLRLPIIGHIHHMSKRPHRALQKLAQKYGPLMLVKVGPVPFYIVSSAKLAREISKSEDTSIPARPRLKAANVLFPGHRDLIFSPYGHFWRHARKICVNELLSLKRVLSFHHIREQEVAKMGEVLRCNKPSSPVNLGTMFVKLADTIVRKAVLGEKYGGDECSKLVGELARNAADLVSGPCLGDYFPMLSWFDTLTGHTAKAKRTSQGWNKFLDQVIDEHQARPGHAVARLDDAKDFVDILLQLQKEDTVGLELTRENIKSILVDMFVGSIDTSAAIMEWIMAELAKHPTIMKKVQEEIRRVVGDKKKIDEQDFQHMEYYQCVIKESLRLHGPSTMARQTSSATTLGGFDIPGDTTVFINLWAIQRDPMLWEKPLEFKPERFLNTSHGFKGQDDKYFPFGMGKRICPGSQFALSEVEYAIANLLCWFDWKLPEGVKPEDLDMHDTFALVTRKESPLYLVPSLHNAV